MRIRGPAAIAVSLFATPWLPAAAQQTRDRPTLIFTISAAYVDGAAVWSVADQPVPDLSGPAPLVDHFALSRSVKTTIGAGFSGTYYGGQHFGVTGEVFLVGVGYDDSCALVAPPQSENNVARCNSINDMERSAAAVTTSVGAVYRVASDEFLSPFVRASVGMLINNQSPLLVVGQSGQAELIIYDDENKGTRLRPAFALGIGTTIAAGKGYQLRWEIRDNIVGIQAVTGPAPSRGQVPPNETQYKHLLSLNFGLDIILERHRGRRY